MPRRSGFSLVELVVVIMILGILAAIAVPKLVGVTNKATDGGLRQSLSVIRDALDRYAADHDGAMPPATSEQAFKDALKPYLRGTEFPRSPVGTRANTIKFSNVDSDADLPIDGMTGWVFNSKDGRFAPNCSDVSRDGTTCYKDF